MIVVHHHHKVHHHKKPIVNQSKTKVQVQRKPVVTPIQKPAQIIPQGNMVDTVHKLVNAYRATHNLPPLQLDHNINSIAHVHSKNMAMGTAPFSHDGFQSRVNEIKKSIKGVKAWGENLAMNKGVKDPAQTAVNGWIDSPGHKANMLGDYNKAGIGVGYNPNSGYFFTQLFIKA